MDIYFLITVITNAGREKAVFFFSCVRACVHVRAGKGQLLKCRIKAKRDMPASHGPRGDIVGSMPVFTLKISKRNDRFSFLHKAMGIINAQARKSNRLTKEDERIRSLK